MPTLGGEPRPYLEGAAEVTWSPDGSQLAYHTALPGDPLFIGDGKGLSRSSPILIAPSGLHSHFPVWAPGNLIYFSKGSLPDQLDVWRVDPHGDASRTHYLALDARYLSGAAQSAHLALPGERAGRLGSVGLWNGCGAAGCAPPNGGC